MASEDYLGWKKSRDYRIAPWERRKRDPVGVDVPLPERLKRLKRRNYKLLSLPELLEAKVLVHERSKKRRKYSNQWAESYWWSPVMTSDAMVQHPSGEHKLVRDCSYIHSMDAARYIDVEHGIQIDQQEYDGLEGITLQRSALGKNAEHLDTNGLYGWDILKGPNLVENLMKNPMWSHYIGGNYSLTESYMSAYSERNSYNFQPTFSLSLLHHREVQDEIVVYPLSLWHYLIGGLSFRNAGEPIGHKQIPG